MRTTKRNKRSVVSASSAGGATTIEGLHASFDRINNKVKAMMDSGKSDAELMRGIRSAWSEQFHSILSDVAIRGLIVHFRSIHKPVSTSKKTIRRRQRHVLRGGNSLSLDQSPQNYVLRGGMAPLEMAQGITASTYGHFPVGFNDSPEMVKSLDLGRFYESSVGRSCNSTGGHQTGGAFWDALLNGAVLRSVPPNTVEKVADAVTATPSGSTSSDPVSGSVSHMTSTPAPFNAGQLSNFAELKSITQ